MSVTACPPPMSQDHQTEETREVARLFQSAHLLPRPPRMNRLWDLPTVVVWGSAGQPQWKGRSQKGGI